MINRINGMFSRDLSPATGYVFLAVMLVAVVLGSVAAVRAGHWSAPPNQLYVAGPTDSFEAPARARSGQGMVTADDPRVQEAAADLVARLRQLQSQRGQ